jgi:hypothetical protein
VPLDTSFQTLLTSHVMMDDRRMFAISSELEPKGAERDQIQ